MGQWFARFLQKEGFEVTISGRDQTRLASVQEDLGVKIATNIDLVKASDVVLLSVTIDSFEGVYKRDRSLCTT